LRLDHLNGIELYLIGQRKMKLPTESIGRSEQKGDRGSNSKKLFNYSVAAHEKNEIYSYVNTSVGLSTTPK